MLQPNLKFQWVVASGIEKNREGEWDMECLIFFHFVSYNFLLALPSAVSVVSAKKAQSCC